VYLWLETPAHLGIPATDVWAIETKFLIPRQHLSDVKQMLNAIEQGDARSANKLLPLVYEKLRLFIHLD
jgi:hypothetical protein